MRAASGIVVAGLLWAGCARDQTLVLDWLDACEGCGVESENPGPAPAPVPDPWTVGLRADEHPPGERPFRWSSGGESRFDLVALQTEGRTLILDGFPVPDARPQSVDVDVEGVSLGRLEWTGPARRTLAIPDGVLRRGRNEVRLVYGYVARPIDADPANDDARDLAMAWYQVGLDDASSSVWWRPTPTSQRVRWRTRGRATSAAEIAWWIDRGGGTWEELRRTSLVAGQRVAEDIDVDGKLGSVARLGLATLSGEVRWEDVHTEVPARGVDRRPLVLVTLDTTRRDALGCYADGPVTPTLDRLAAEGIVWEQAYSPTPATAPTHAGLLLSKWPAEHGLKVNGRPLPRADGTHALVQAQAWGYRTAAFISLGVLTRDLGFDQGVDDFDGELNQRWWRFAAEVNEHALPWIDAHPQGDGRPPGFIWLHYADPHKPYGVVDEPGQRLIVSVNGAVVDTMNTMGLEQSWPVMLRNGRNEIRLDSLRRYHDDREHWFVRRKAQMNGTALDFGSGWTPVRGYSRMRETATLTFDASAAGAGTLMLNMEDLPLPAEARRRYAQEVTAVDHAIADLFDHLQRAGWLSRGIVMLVADHGEDLGEGGHFGHVEHVGPTLTHVPMILWSRDVTPARPTHPVSVIDVMPTLWSMLNLPRPAAWTGQDARVPDAGRVLRLETFPPEAQRHWRGVVTSTGRLARVVDEDTAFVDLDGTALDSIPPAALAAWQAWPGEASNDVGPIDPAMRERLKALGYAN